MGIKKKGENYSTIFIPTAALPASVFSGIISALKKAPHVVCLRNKGNKKNIEIQICISMFFCTHFFFGLRGNQPFATRFSCSNNSKILQ